MVLAQSTIDALGALAVGFAFAGLVASAFEMLVRRPLGLATLQTGDLAAAASVPVLVFSAPLVMIRNVVRRGRRLTIPAVVAITALSGFWSMACGRLVLDLAMLVTHA
jgi:hypothetical protein